MRWVTWTLRWVLTPAEVRKALDWIREQTPVQALKLADARAYRRGQHDMAIDAYLAGVAAGKRQAEEAARTAPPAGPASG